MEYLHNSLRIIVTTSRAPRTRFIKDIGKANDWKASYYLASIRYPVKTK